MVLRRRAALPNTPASAACTPPGFPQSVGSPNYGLPPLPQCFAFIAESEVFGSPSLRRFCHSGFMPTFSKAHRFNAFSLEKIAISGTSSNCISVDCLVLGDDYRT